MFKTEDKNIGKMAKLHAWLAPNNLTDKYENLHIKFVTYFFFKRDKLTPYDGLFKNLKWVSNVYVHIQTRYF